jgi:hypothetical protein
VARTLFHLNAHSGTVFSLSDDKDVHLMGHCSPICLLEAKMLCRIGLQIYM